MATKKSIAEQALRVIQGGNISDDVDINIREVILFVEQERDALIKQMILGYAGMGEHEITGDFLSSFTVTSSNNQIVLKYSPINLPNNVGIYSIANGLEFYLRRPSSNMYSNALSKSTRKFYEVVGNTYTFFPTVLDSTEFTVKLIVSSKDLGENDNFPIPADLESQIVKSVVQLYGLMRQANEDNINDRKDNKQ